MRVVSLLPSATEILCHIGGAGMLVGRSHECDFPDGLDQVPVLTRQRIDSQSSPAQIDAAVRSSLAGGSSLYTLDAELLGRLKPDLILTQDLCEVCSIDLSTVRTIAAGLHSAPKILSLNPETVEDVLDDILRVGAATGLQGNARSAVVGLRERMYAAADYVSPYLDGPCAAVLEWPDPLFVAGHWTPQLVERAGARHPLNPTAPVAGFGAAAGSQQAARKAGKSIRITPEALVAVIPERLIIASCGASLPQTRIWAQRLTREPWWADLPAVRQGQVALVDGNQMFSRPGPRLIDAYQWLVGWVNERPHLIPADFPWEPFRG
jgi:iron complex transport system substrate-binding protein